MASCFKMPPHTWTLGGCLCLYFSLLDISIFAKALSSGALQLYGRIICEDYVIKQLVLFKAFLASVQSFLFICILNRLTVSGSGEGPAKLLAKPCNGSHTVLNICCPNYLCQDIFEGSVFINSSHCFINAKIMALRNSVLVVHFWGGLSHCRSSAIL